MSQVILITGTSSGIGKQAAISLAEKGYTVYAASRTPEKVNAASDNLIPIKIDLNDPNQIQVAVDQIKQKHGRIDVLINNAGYALVSSVEECDEQAMLAQFNINVFGIFRACKAVIPLMRENHSGVIINISSFLGKVGLPLFTFYNSTKYAVEGITDSLRYELREHNIRVHSVLPGFFSTQFAKDNLIINAKTLAQDSPYQAFTNGVLPNIASQINDGNSVDEVADLLYKIINDPSFPARETVGDKARKFIPMRRELNDEEFERRVIEYYQLNG